MGPKLRSKRKREEVESASEDENEIELPDHEDDAEDDSDDPTSLKELPKKNVKKPKKPAKKSKGDEDSDEESYEPDAGLLASPAQRPLQSAASSNVPLSRLRLLEFRLFDGLTMSQTETEFKKHIGKAGWDYTGSPQYMSRLYREAGAKWFQEQGARRPWDMLSNKEKNMAKKHGLTKEDYPLIDPGKGAPVPGDLGAGSSSTFGPATIKGPPSTSTTHGGPGGTVDGLHFRRPSTSTGTGKIVKTSPGDPSDSEDSDSDGGSDGDMNHKLDPFDITPGDENVNDYGKDDIVIEMARFRAIANRVGDVALFKLIGPRSIEFIRKDALNAHCRLSEEYFSAQSLTLEADYAGHILRAFIECISPTLNDQLPRILFNFYRTDTEIVNNTHPDVYRIVFDHWRHGPDYDFLVLGWNLWDSLDIFRLACELECDHVKNLAINRIHCLYEKMTESGENFEDISEGQMAPLINLEDILQLQDPGNQFFDLWGEIIFEFARQTEIPIAIESFDESARNAYSKASLDYEKEIACKIRGVSKEEFCTRFHYRASDNCVTDNISERKFGSTRKIIASVYNHLRKSATEIYNKPIFHRYIPPNYRERDHDFIAEHGRRQLKSESDRDLTIQYLTAEEAMLEAKLRLELGTRRAIAKRRKEKSVGDKLTDDNRMWRERIEAEKAHFHDLKRQADEASPPI